MANLNRKITAGSSSADITSALEQARADLVGAETSVEMADAAYESGLLDLDKVALRTLLDARADAKIEVDRCRAVIAKLEGQLEKTSASEAEEARRVAYEQAKAASEAARKKLHRDYPKACESIRDILRALAEADIAVAAANADLPEGASRLAGPESDRSTPAQWKNTLSEELVELWAGIGGQSTPVAEELQRSVQPDARPRRGVAHNGDEAMLCGRVQVEDGGVLEVVRRRFIRRRVLPDMGGYNAAALASELKLPALHAGAEPFWEPSPFTPSSVLSDLDAPLRPRPDQPKREPVYEYSLAPSRKEHITNEEN